MGERKEEKNIGSLPLRTPRCIACLIRWMLGSPDFSGFMEKLAKKPFTIEQFQETSYFIFVEVNMIIFFKKLFVNKVFIFFVVFSYSPF
jgi:hypothetical protein